MRWQCAPISQGMTVAPSGGTARASGTAAARTSSAEPAAATRDQHGPGRPVVAGHRDDDRVLKEQLHRSALQPGRSVQDAGSKISMGALGAGDSSEFLVAGEQGGAQGFGERYVGGVVDGEVVP
jgi:hypothetical protein